MLTLPQVVKKRRQENVDFLLLHTPSNQLESPVSLSISEGELHLPVLTSPGFKEMAMAWTPSASNSFWRCFAKSRFASLDMAICQASQQEPFKSSMEPCYVPYLVRLAGPSSVLSNSALNIDKELNLKLGGKSE